MPEIPRPMPIFVVTLTTGRRLAIRADRCVATEGSVQLMADAAGDSPLFGTKPTAEVVGFFDRSRVVAVVAADHLVDEAEEPMGGPFDFADGNAADDPAPA